jgi:hypothetical protein
MRRTVELHVFALLIASALGALLAGCGDDRAPEKPKTTGSHVWRGQTDMYFEARDVAKDVNAQLNAQEAALERARRGD